MSLCVTYCFALGNTFARCTLCSTDFSISNGGKSNVTSHLKGKKHMELVAGSSSTMSVTSFFETQFPKTVIEAEAQWALFVAKHNLAFLTSDHATKLFKQMFPDSEIAKKFACGRTKCTAILKEALAPYYHAKAIHNMSSPFSILIDESNNKVDKSCIILVRFVDEQLGNVKTRFLDMPVVNIGTARNIFNAVKESLQKFNLDFSNAMAFMSDTANVMKGARSGVQKLIKDENPILYDVGCICHLADLCIKAGMKTLLIDIDQLFIDIYYYFSHSSKRQQQFTDVWHSFYESEPKVILKHCPTRWLSLLRCIGRYLEQLEGLISYFLSCDDQTAKVVSITKRLQNPLTKPIPLFLKHVLPHMDRFNRSFQKSTENTTCELYTEITRLVKIYAVNILTHEAVLEANEIHLIDLNKAENIKPDENLSIGHDTWLHIPELEEVIDQKPFFLSVKQFYLVTLQKMIKKFPFADTLMKDLGIIRPNMTKSYSISTIKQLALRFPQIGLSSSESLALLESEFSDYILSPVDLPTVEQYRDCDGTEKPRPGPFWWEVSKMIIMTGELRFPNLSKLMVGLLSIPCSNADSERGFSVLRKIQTDQRSNLDQTTIVSLMSLKFNSDECCHEMDLNSQLLTNCKKATFITLHK